MRDHEKRELVSRLTNVAVEFHGAQQLRARIAAEVLPAIESAVAAERERCARPLRRLGSRLAELLDEDQWSECEALLLDAGVTPNTELKDGHD